MYYLFSLIYTHICFVDVDLIINITLPPNMCCDLLLFLYLNIFNVLEIVWSFN